MRAEKNFAENALMEKASPSSDTCTSTTSDTCLESRVETFLLKVLNVARYVFIVMMIIYLGQCIVSLGYKMVAFTLNQGALIYKYFKTRNTIRNFYK